MSLLKISELVVYMIAEIFLLLIQSGTPLIDLLLKKVVVIRANGARESMQFIQLRRKEENKKKHRSSPCRSRKISL